MTSRKPTWRSWADVPEKLRRSVIQDTKDRVVYYEHWASRVTSVSISRTFAKRALAFRLALKRLGVKR